jgi:hypothetical protein
MPPDIIDAEAIRFAESYVSVAPAPEVMFPFPFRAHVVANFRAIDKVSALLHQEFVVIFFGCL